jgi:hypothetical protein
MHVEALAVRLRPRTPTEAVDLGVRLCQSVAPSVYRCYLAVAIPVMVLATASIEVAGWLPTIAIWWSKPWLDRTILFVLSRAAFGQDTTLADLWRAQWHVWWKPLVFSLTVRRLSPWRSLTEPVYLLEGGSAWSSRPRIRQIRYRNAGAAFMMTQAFSITEIALSMSLMSLIVWFAPSGQAPDLFSLFTGETPGLLAVANIAAYGVAVLFLEPFYVAAGFAMYLNRRAELEAWDIEQEFRRAFGE